jgi:hypothetical protein
MRMHRSLRLLLVLAIAAGVPTSAAAQPDDFIELGPFFADLAVNPITGMLFGPGGAELHRVDPSDHAIDSVGVAADARAVRIDPVRNEVWVLHERQPLVTVVDGATLAAASVPLAGVARGIALDPSAGRLFVALIDAIAVIDTATRQVATLPVPGLQSVVADPHGDGALAFAYEAATDPDWVAYGFAHRIGGSPPAIADSLSFETGSFIETGLAAELHADRALIGNFDGAPIAFDWAARTHLVPDDFFGFASFGFAGEPSAGRMWVLSEDPFLPCAANFLYRYDVAANEGDILFHPCTDRLAVSPATGRAYTTLSDEMEVVPGVYFVDTDALSATFHPNGSAAGGGTSRATVDVATNRLYVLSWTFLSTSRGIEVWNEPVTAPVPLDVEIAVEPIVPGLDPVVHFSATSGFAPHPLPIRQVFHQVDATDGVWSPTDAPGAESSATLAGLAPGTHTVYAFATDGQDASTSETATTLVVGPIASLEITVPPPPACSNGADDDGDGAADHPADPGCRSALARREDPECDNDLDDDGDGLVDLADNGCGFAADNREGVVSPGGCGLGVEIALALAALLAARERAR